MKKHTLGGDGQGTVWVSIIIFSNFGGKNLTFINGDCPDLANGEVNCHSNIKLKKQAINVCALYAW